MTTTPTRAGRAARRASVLAAGALLTAGLTGAPASSATVAARAAAPAPSGTTSLAEVLAADGNRLDGNWRDFDILEKAVRAVLAEKPRSAVAVLADGETRLTAFLPTDRAFRRLVNDLTGARPRTEARTLAKLVKLVDVKTIEAVLLYHVKPGWTAGSAKVLKAARRHTKLVTALGSRIQLDLVPKGIRILDADPDDYNGFVTQPDINQGNRQIGHGVSQVLRPVDL